MTQSIHEHHIKTTLTMMSKPTKVPTATLREHMKDLCPPGTALDAQMVFNFRLKVKRMIDNGIIDMRSHTVTEQEASCLLAPDDLEKCQTPEFHSEVFAQCRELLELALKDRNELHQITTHLDNLGKVDRGFTHRMALSSDGTATGFVWMTPVMRRDFELFGGTLFIDRKGRSLKV